MPFIEQTKKETQILALEKDTTPSLSLCLSLSLPHSLSPPLSLSSSRPILSLSLTLLPPPIQDIDTA